MERRNEAILVTSSTRLPEIAKSKEGFVLYPRNRTWHVVDQARSANFSFDELSDYYEHELVFSFQYALLHYIAKYALSHACNMHTLFLHFTRSIPKPMAKYSTISSNLIINYKAFLGKDAWYLGSLKGFFKTWYKLGYCGIEDDAIKLLDSLRIKGNPKGHAVLTMDPINGPFTENELLSIHEELCNKYASGEISNREFALVWLSMAVGQRPVQFAMAKVKDFIEIPAADGSVRYLINMPRAKQRGVEARELFSERVLCNDAGNALAVWKEHLKTTKMDVPFGELPLFPRWGHISPVGLHHMTSQMLAVELAGIIDKLKVISERTGEALKFQSKRFKFTIGTRAAEEGHGELVIAQLLDHTDTQNVRVYVQSTAKMAGIIDKAMAPYMAPIAQAFKGMIIRSDDDCPDGIRIRSGHPSTGDVGKCGHHGFCGAAAPHVCYVCVNFHPWLDGPHEEILKELTDERERILAITKDKRIAGAKDRLIMAVTQVVEMCKVLQMQGAING